MALANRLHESRFPLVAPPAAPIDADTAKRELNELLSLGVYIELVVAALLGELRHIEVRVHGVFSGTNGASSHGEPPRMAGRELDQMKCSSASRNVPSGGKRDGLF